MYSSNVHNTYSLSSCSSRNSPSKVEAKSRAKIWEGVSGSEELAISVAVTKDS